MAVLRCPPLPSRCFHIPPTALSGCFAKSSISLISVSRHSPSPRIRRCQYHHKNIPDWINDPIFLRDSCSCPRCVDPSTSQKLFATADIPLNIEPMSIEPAQKGGFLIKWKNDIPGYDAHSSTLSSNFLETQTSVMSRLRNSPEHIKSESGKLPNLHQTLWDREMMIKYNLIIPYKDYMHSKPTLFEALRHLHIYGMLYLSNVPSDPTAVDTIANRIGPLRNTLYGSTWNVKSKPSAKNIAYTSKHLGFHMDLLYMADPPGLQILHCMRASNEGGESLFTDSFRAVDVMNRLDRNLLAAFGSFPITYRYKNDGSWYEQTRTTIEGKDILGTIIQDEKRLYNTGPSADYAINWSPPFQAPLEQDVRTEKADRDEPSDGRLYLQGAKMFKEIIEADNAVFETKMQPGTCAIFNNRRILHARRAFGADGGERWLRGAYVDTDAFKSRMRVLGEEFGAGGAAKQIV